MFDSSASNSPRPYTHTALHSARILVDLLLQKLFLTLNQVFGGFLMFLERQHRFSTKHMTTEDFLQFDWKRNAKSCYIVEYKSFKEETNFD